jgi:IS30 family transposase
MPAAVKRRYFELIRTGLSGSAAAQEVGVSLSCGSVWFIDAGRVSFIETPISPRYLSQDDRIEIADGLARGEPVKVIAARIGKCFQSVYREIARNRKPDGRYQPWYAHTRAYQRRRRPKPRRFSMDAELAKTVAGKLAKRWSSRDQPMAAPPLPAAAFLACMYRNHLRSGLPRPDRPSRRAKPAHRTHLPAPPGRGRTRDGALKQSTTMKSIHQRPSSVASRRQAGHWEGDLLVGAGQRSAIATLVERKFRTTVLVPIARDHTAKTAADALIAAFGKLPIRLRRTLTWDQGNEMFQHQRIEQATGLKVYFADPHSPWQRGSNENVNGLLRQYFPKGTDLNAWTAEQLNYVAAELNDRPPSLPRRPDTEPGHATMGASTDTTMLHNVR